MIELTKSHYQIINWQAEKKPDDWIAGKLGYTREQFADALGIIHRWREQETARRAGK